MKFSQGLSAANLQIYEILRKIAKNWNIMYNLQVGR